MSTATVAGAATRLDRGTVRPRTDGPDDTTMTDIQLHDLDANWSESTDDPLTLHESDDPTAETGTFVIEPGERVPAEGTTSHAGDEVSVILSGELEVVTEESRTVGANTLSVIPAGVEHYSVNHGPEPVRLVYTILGEL
ncbi:cupin domain-containing protein [Halostella litorea]|uniref:cupin domain-containing protein n=1 Tax=Halostella litorea TaxID=2528831 RepID=UPI001F1F0038|nr:cupin domain-containing protein [Halostella litorea]